MKNFVMLLLLLVTFSCTGQETNVQGLYKSPVGTKINLFRYGATIVGAELNLKKDGTYVYSTCAQISEGYWKKEKSEMILTCTKQKFIIDSLNHIEKYAKGTRCYSQMKLQVFKNKLQEVTPGLNRNYKLILIKED